MCAHICVCLSHFHSFQSFTHSFWSASFILFNMDFSCPISARSILLLFSCVTAVRVPFLPVTSPKMYNRSGVVTLNPQPPACMHVCLMAFRFQLNVIAIYCFFFRLCFSPWCDFMHVLNKHS